VLAERLPPGAVPVPGHPLSWTHESYLLAQLIDEVAALTYVTLRAHGSKPPKPKPFPRPKPARGSGRAATPPPPKRTTSWADLAGVSPNGG
jgi:hypothetical protein